MTWFNPRVTITALAMASAPEPWILFFSKKLLYFYMQDLKHKNCQHPFSCKNVILSFFLCL